MTAACVAGPHAWARARYSSISERWRGATRALPTLRRAVRKLWPSTPDQVRGRPPDHVRARLGRDLRLVAFECTNAGAHGAYLRERAPFSIALVSGLVFPFFLTVSS